MANARKHSGATQLTVTLARRRRTLAGMVADNGRGFIPEQNADRPDRVLHIGLESMTERVRLAGGDLDIDSDIGSGTRVTFEIPLAQGPVEAPGPSWT